MSWKDVTAAVFGDSSGQGLQTPMLQQILSESAYLSLSQVYKKSGGLSLNPSVPGGSLKCPTASYFDAMAQLSTARIALAGYRLSFLLRAVAKQLQSKSLGHLKISKLLQQKDIYGVNDLEIVGSGLVGTDLRGLMESQSRAAAAQKKADPTAKQ